MRPFVVSGGQTGADRAAMDAAMRVGLPVRGWCPAGREAEDGPIPLRYPLRETLERSPGARTRYNVRDADALIALAPFESSAGTALALAEAERLGKPALIVELEQTGSAEGIAAWVQAHGARSINIAGPRESERPGVYNVALEALMEAFILIREHVRMELVNRATEPSVALETTLLAHGVPRDSAGALSDELAAIVRAEGVAPAVVGVVSGVPTIGMTDDELASMLEEPSVAKANCSNLGALMHRRAMAATTVSATMELASRAGVRIFATGGVGGVHQGYGEALDVSADLGAFSRFPVAVVSSGVKSILDVESTREAFETLGVPVVGFMTSRFPAFYLRASRATVDERFDEVPDLARFLATELERTNRGVLVVNPIPQEDEIDPADWELWLEAARSRALAVGATGRDITPRILAELHDVSGGATLRANLALVKSNAQLAAQLCAAMCEF